MNQRTRNTTGKTKGNPQRPANFLKGWSTTRHVSRDIPEAPRAQGQGQQPSQADKKKEGEEGFAYAILRCVLV
jgi:hypothetical protein